MSEQPSYHNLHVTTSKIKRTSIFNLPYGYEIACSRVTGWQLWAWADTDTPDPFGNVRRNRRCIAEEYGAGLRLDVDGHVIVDSLTKAQASAS